MRVGQTLTGIYGQPLPYPIVFKITSRSITKKGQKLAFPEIDVETYWCSLAQMPALEVIDLYHDHGTSEQYHSELKSDMDIGAASQWTLCQQQPRAAPGDVELQYLADHRSAQPGESPERGDQFAR